MPDTNAFKILRAQRPHTDEELELIQGDFAYITDDSWSTSPEHWVFGTSWLTGQAGYIPKNFVTQTAETNTWTVHVALSLSGKDSTNSNANLPKSTSTASIERLKELASVVTNSTWTLNAQSEISEAQSVISSKSVKKNIIRDPRRIFVVRHGERVDFTFNSWIQHSFDESGKYSRKDLNMPESVPLRMKGPVGFARYD